MEDTWLLRSDPALRCDLDYWTLMAGASLVGVDLGAHSAGNRLAAHLEINAFTERR